MGRDIKWEEIMLLLPPTCQPTPLNWCGKESKLCQEKGYHSLFIPCTKQEARIKLWLPVLQFGPCPVPWQCGHMLPLFTLDNNVFWIFCKVCLGHQSFIFRLLYSINHYSVSRLSLDSPHWPVPYFSSSLTDYSGATSKERYYGTCIRISESGFVLGIYYSL